MDKKNKKIWLIITVAIGGVFGLLYFYVTSESNKKNISRKLAEADLQRTGNNFTIDEVTEWYMNRGDLLLSKDFTNSKPVKNLGFFELLKLTFKNIK